MGILGRLLKSGEGEMPLISPRASDEKFLFRPVNAERIILVMANRLSL